MTSDQRRCLFAPATLTLLFLEHPGMFYIIGLFYTCCSFCLGCFSTPLPMGCCLASFTRFLNCYVVRLFYKGANSLTGVSSLLASLGHTGGRRVVLGHTLNTQTLTKANEQKNVLSKFTTLCRAVFIGILCCMRPCGPWVGQPCCHWRVLSKGGS